MPSALSFTNSMYRQRSGSPCSPREDVMDENTIATFASLGLDDQEEKHFGFHPFPPPTRSLLRPRAISLGMADHFSPFPVPTLKPTQSINNLIESYSQQENSPQPSRALWLGNINPSLSVPELTQRFSSYGSIESTRILSDKECAFINFHSVESALAAKSDLEAQGTLAGTPVRVGFGKPEVAVTDSQGPTRALWVGHLPATTSSQALKDIFETFGRIESVRILSHKNCAFINFEHQEDAVRARRVLQSKQILGHPVRIGFAKVPEDQDYQVTQWATAVMMANMMMNTTGKPTVQPSLYTAIASERLFIMQQLGLDDSDAFKVDRLPLVYRSSILPVPELGSDRKLEPLLLREMRKVLEGEVSIEQAELMAADCMEDIVELCSDYIGNTVVQKLFEYCTQETKYAMLQKIAPYLASIGVHKNGTWAAQKMIDYAGPEQMDLIRTHLAPYVPLLLLDQFGNYVVQCCLWKPDNQYIFDAIADKCWEIGQGRFGARAVRSILENPIVNQKQRLFLASAIVQNAVLLTTNPNGILLLNWFLDSQLPSRYRVLCPRLLPYLNKLCSHKLGSQTVQKIVQQTEEHDSATLLLNSLPEKSRENLLQRNN
ncbi:hypothetical protein G6F56_003194 [Rhizopus delemar]|nr:hypothetical protein G6F56_003194 [Rhizopus delemar]